MTLNNPSDQPSVEQITTKNTFSYTSHDYHPLTGTPFPENNTAIPTTPTTPTTLTTLATTDHPDSNFPLPLTTLVHTTLPSIVTLSAAKGFSMGRKMLRCAQHDTALPYYCALAIEPYERHIPVYVTQNISFLERQHVLPHKMVNSRAI